MASINQASHAERHTFSRLARNIGWLLGGKGWGGLFSLFYLAAAARALGPVQFGVFALILTYAQLVANLIQFQSWKGVIRFGATHFTANRPDRLARLLGYTAVLDWSTAIAGMIVAALGVFAVAPQFGWSHDVQVQAAAFAAGLLLTTGGTPSGMLRLFDRFDLLTYSEAVSPAIRLIGAIIAWITGGGVAAFLVVWVVAALIQTIATWIAAVAIHRTRLSIGARAFRLAIKENPGLWKFMWQASLSSSLGFLWLQTGILAVGAVAGPAIAGGFRLADRIASALAKPTETVTRALYPELARLVAGEDHARVRWLFKRTVVVSAIIAVLLVLLCATEGRLILELVAGSRFTFAQPFLVILSISAAIDVAGFALEPILNAHGKAAEVLHARIAGAIVYLLLLVALLPAIGPVGAAVAAAASCALMVGQLALSVRRLLSKS